MEKIDFGNTYFTTHGMMPGAGETVSLLWARKTVNNLANAYGIIGTVNFGGGRGYRSFNLELTRKYTFPPSVYLYYVDSTGCMNMPIETHPSFGEYEPMDGILYEAGEWRKKVYALIQSDNLIIFCPCLDIYNVYYRIVGV